MSHANLLFQKIKSFNQLQQAVSHNTRKIASEIRPDGHINSNLMHLNESIQRVEPPHVVGIFKQKVAQAGIHKTRKNAVLAIEFIVSLNKQTIVNDRLFFQESSHWLAEYFGGVNNLLSAEIHRDEAHPHCHIIIVPIINGSLRGSDRLGNMPKVEDLKNKFYEEVAKKYGLLPAPKALKGERKLEAYRLIVKHLEDSKDTLLLSSLSTLLLHTIKTNPSPVLLALGLDLPPQKRKERTLVEIFTSKGKGGNTES